MSPVNLYIVDNSIDNCSVNFGIFSELFIIVDRLTLTGARGRVGLWKAFGGMGKGGVHWRQDRLICRFNLKLFVGVTLSPKYR